MSTRQQVMAQSTAPEIEALRQKLELLENTIIHQNEEILRQEVEIEAMQRQLEDLSANDDTQIPNSVPVVNISADVEGQSDTPEVAEKPDNPKSPLPDGRFPDDAIVTTGDFPGSINIPGTNTSFRIGGFVRLQGIYDFDSLGRDTGVFNRTIPLDGSEEDGTDQLKFFAQNSRLNFDFRRNTKRFPIRTFIEGDFASGGNEFGSSFQFRLRHAVVQFSNFSIGQWWTSFADIQALPEQSGVSPVGAPNIRQPGIQWANETDTGWKYGLAVENPEGDLSGPDNSFASESFPDLISHVQFKRSWGHVRVAGILRKLNSTDDEEFVVGGNLSSRIPLRFLGERDNIAFQVQAGQGITRYQPTLAGAGLDGIVDTDGTLDTISSVSGYLAYQHWWSDLFRSNLIVGFVDLDLPSSASSDTFENGLYTNINFFLTPIEDITFGIDVIYADQMTFGGESGSGVRLETSARYSF
ncbi:MAG: DcaP family trimeric outer membrane transporter [Cyanobacteria bacterium J06600_6]